MSKILEAIIILVFISALFLNIAWPFIVTFFIANYFSYPTPVSIVLGVIANMAWISFNGFRVSVKKL